MTCTFCDAHFPRSFGEHVAVDGARVLGPCTAPDAHAPLGAPFPFRERMDAWRGRMAELLRQPKLAPVSHWTEDDKL